MLAASPQLNIPQPNVPDVSSETILAISGARSESSSPARISTARRSAGSVAAHAGNACAAAVTAASTSATPAAAWVETGSPVNELITSAVAPVAASRHWPPMKSC